MFAPGGSDFTTSVAINCARWISAVARLPEITSTVRESVEYPALLTLIECAPGCRFVSAHGVTQLGSLRPSLCTCAPCGVESIAIFPGIIAGATTAGFLLCGLRALGLAAACAGA